MNLVHKSAFSISIPILSLFYTSYKSRLLASPTFGGIPVGATFLMHQGLPIFQKEFPGLEMSAVDDSDECFYSEKRSIGNHKDGPLDFFLLKLIGPKEAIVQIPIYERYSQQEEERLGNAGIKKASVGKLTLKGSCDLGCAKVLLKEMILYKGNGQDIVWSHQISP